MFINMPWTEECAEWSRPYLDQIALGIDVNISTGRPLLLPEEIPSLVRADGSFHSCWESRKLDTEENNFEHTSYKDLYKEFDAQIKRFIELVGKKPDYIHAHAYVTNQTTQVQRDLAKKMMYITVPM